jgi:hypothetical protein
MGESNGRHIRRGQETWQNRVWNVDLFDGGDLSSDDND